MPQFIFTQLAAKKFNKLSPEIQARLQKKLISYREHPDFFNLLEPLIDFGKATHRLRVGDYRVILSITSEETLSVLDIGHRKNIYK